MQQEDETLARATVFAQCKEQPGDFDDDCRHVRSDVYALTTVGQCSVASIATVVASWALARTAGAGWHSAAAGCSFQLVWQACTLFSWGYLYRKLEAQESKRADQVHLSSEKHARAQLSDPSGGHHAVQWLNEALRRTWRTLGPSLSKSVFESAIQPSLKGMIGKLCPGVELSDIGFDLPNFSLGEQPPLVNFITFEPSARRVYGEITLNANISIDIAKVMGMKFFFKVGGVHVPLPLILCDVLCEVDVKIVLRMSSVTLFEVVIAQVALNKPLDLDYALRFTVQTPVDSAGVAPSGFSSSILEVTSIPGLVVCQTPSH